MIDSDFLDLRQEETEQFTTFHFNEATHTETYQTIGKNRNFLLNNLMGKESLFFPNAWLAKYTYHLLMQFSLYLILSNNNISSV